MTEIRPLSRYAGVLLVVLTCLTASCGRAGRVSVGIMTKLQAGSIVGSSEINAARLFTDDHPGTRMAIIPIDDGWDPAKALSAYRELRGRGVRVIITSHISTCALAISDAVNNDRTLTLVTGAATDRLTGRDDYHIRLIPDVASEQRAIADYLNKRPEGRVLVIRDTDNDKYTTPALNHFKKALTKPLVRVIDLSIASVDLEALSRALTGTEFDAAYLLIGGYNITAGSVAQVVHRANPNAAILFTPWMRTPTIMETLGGAAKKAIMSSHFPPRRSNPAIDGYIARYIKRFGYAPTFISLNVFRAMEILDRAIAAGNSDPEDIKRYIIKTGTFKTVFGPMSFNRSGDVESPLYFITDLPGEF